MKNQKHILLAVGFIATVILVPAFELDARERGERQYPAGRGHGETHTSVSSQEPIIIPQEILEEWKEDIEEGNFEKVIEEFEDIVENGLPQPTEPEPEGDVDEGGEGDETGGEGERRPRTRTITRDRGETPVDEEPQIEEEEPAPEEPVEEDNGGEEPTYAELVALQTHRLTNIEREKRGLMPLENNQELSGIAKMHGEYMAETGYFSHTTLEGCDLGCRLNGGGFDASAWGENIAWRSSSVLPSAEELAFLFVRGWINSPGHRDNMMSENFTLEGIGVAQIENTVFATVDFVRP